MKKKLLAITLVLASAFALNPVHADFYDNTTDSQSERARKCYRGARKPAFIIDFRDVGTRANMTPVEVRDAITRAGNTNKWTVQDAGGSGESRLEASLVVRNKHKIVVDIPYTADKYSLLYKNSNNMNYAACDGERYIHPNYNVWVNRFNQEIQKELSITRR